VGCVIVDASGSDVVATGHNLTNATLNVRALPERDEPFELKGWLAMATFPVGRRDAEFTRMARPADRGYSQAAASNGGPDNVPCDRTSSSSASPMLASSAALP
jgi:hypothetical protein